MTIRIHWIMLGLLLALTPAFAQTIDYDLNQATRTIRDVDSGLQRLRPGDVATYNRLSAKMTKAADHLKATQSQSHPDFEAAVKRWSELQTQMAAIAQQWNAAAAQQQAQQAATQAAPAPAPAPAAQQPTPAPAPAPAPGAQQAAPQAASVEPVNLDPIMDKYQRQNLPKLADTATPDEARAWAEHMRSLQTTTLEEDIATIDAALSSGAASKPDADRVRQWISDQFQNSISRTIRDQVLKPDGTIASMKYVAELINGVEDGDMNGAYRFAGDMKYENNATRLDAAIQAGAVADVFDEVFGTDNPDRAEKVANLKAARKRLDELKPVADEQAKILAGLPRKERKKNKDFLAPIAQEFWLNGSVMAESDDEGNIWVSGDDIGDITHNGTIWVQANERGSIEPNGEVWFDGNEVGSLEPNGEVWRGGNQVGLIDENGKVWINGSADGEIVPYNGEWKRAAVLYYFRDYFR